jgi:hypothetical protein
MSCFLERACRKLNIRRGASLWFIINGGMVVTTALWIFIMVARTYANDISNTHNFKSLLFDATFLNMILITVKPLATFGSAKRPAADRSKSLFRRRRATRRWRSALRG